MLLTRKAESPSAVTLLGMTIFVRLFTAKACAPIVTIVFGNITDLSP